MSNPTYWLRNDNAILCHVLRNTIYNYFDIAWLFLDYYVAVLLSQSYNVMVSMT